MDFNLASYEKFDEALNNINTSSSCGLAEAMSSLSDTVTANGTVDSTSYNNIVSEISNLNIQANSLASGDGVNQLINNYVTGYNAMKNAIIESYIAEYEFSLESGTIGKALSQLSELERETIKNEFSNALLNMREKNSSSDISAQYSSLTEFFKDIENSYGKFIDSLGENIEISTNLLPKNNRDIAHRGFTPGGIYDNSIEGFIKAGEEGFWGCETDIRFDANGNLVCSHNAVKKGENPPTLEEYLDICKQYGMTAIIDLKYENGPNAQDDNLSPSVLKVIEAKGMMDSCVIQTNNPIDIGYIRENSSDARIWYLTDVISDSNIELIKENDVECVNILSGEKNTSRIKTLTENGIDVCVWNVQSTLSKNNIINAGAKYVMSDYSLDITPYQEGDIDYNNVTFNINSDISPSQLTIGSLDLEGASVVDLSNTTTVTTSSTFDGVRLTGPMGHTDGPEAYETWYDMDMNTVVENMRDLYGYTNLEASIRGDGVKVLSGTAPDGTVFKNLVMVAADVIHEKENPNGTYERGQIVQTSLGDGIVVDMCGYAKDKRIANSGTHFDLATAWWTEPYHTIAYSDNPYVPLTAEEQSVIIKDGVTILTSSSNDDVVATTTVLTDETIPTENTKPATTVSTTGSSSTTTSTTLSSGSHSSSSSSSSSGSHSNSSSSSSSGSHSSSSSSSSSGSHSSSSSSSSSGSHSSSSSSSSSGSHSSSSSSSSSGSHSSSSSSSSSGSHSSSSSNQGAINDTVVTYTNILPDNKFKTALPELTTGQLGNMEISNSAVNYAIKNIDTTAYNNYIQSLISSGYVVTSNGTYIKNNYEVSVIMNQDGTMSISCKILYL